MEKAEEHLFRTIWFVVFGFFYTVVSVNVVQFYSKVESSDFVWNLLHNYSSPHKFDKHTHGCFDADLFLFTQKSVRIQFLLIAQTFLTCLIVVMLSDVSLLKVSSLFGKKEKKPIKDEFDLTDFEEVEGEKRKIRVFQLIRIVTSLVVGASIIYTLFIAFSTETVPLVNSASTRNGFAALRNCVNQTDEMSHLTFIWFTRAGHGFFHLFAVVMAIFPAFLVTFGIVILFCLSIGYGVDKVDFRCDDIEAVLAEFSRWDWIAFGVVTVSVICHTVTHIFSVLLWHEYMVNGENSITVKHSMVLCVPNDTFPNGLIAGQSIILYLLNAFYFALVYKICRPSFQEAVQNLFRILDSSVLCESN